jgi:F-type H+-transporting ATPase subunit b
MPGAFPSSVIVQVTAGRVSSLRLSGEETTEEEGTNAETTGAHSEAGVPEKEPSPLAPDLFELAWAAGSFLVLLALMRYVLYPRVAKTMDARNNLISSQLAEADAIRDAARAEISDYEADLAKVREEAAGRVDVARQQVESERTAKMAEVNARLADRRAAVAAEIDAAKAGAAAQVASAAGDVASHASSIVLGSTPSADIVRSSVAAVMGAN